MPKSVGDGGGGEVDWGAEREEPERIGDRDIDRGWS
jgi:hypothetical protein